MAQETHELDSAGRCTGEVAAPPPIESMSDSEKLDEILLHLRNVGSFVMQFQGMSPAQLIKAMLTGGK